MPDGVDSSSLSGRRVATACSNSLSGALLGADAQTGPDLRLPAGGAAPTGSQAALLRLARLMGRQAARAAMAASSITPPKDRS